MHRSWTEKLAFAAVVGALAIGAAAIYSSGATAAPDGYAMSAPPQMTEAAVKKHITDENYTDVSNLQKVKEGWTANAKSLGSPVSLLVTDMGDINQQ